jgi:hypothetical protein
MPAGKPRLTFRPAIDLPTNPLTPPELVVPPAGRRGIGSFDPREPIALVRVAGGVVIQFPYCWAHIDLATRVFEVRQVGAVSMIASSRDGTGVLLRSGGVNLRVSVYEVNARSFVDRLHPDFPRRIVAGACCDIELFDLADRSTRAIPGPELDAPVGVVTSPCGNWAWLELTPEDDRLGVFATDNGESVFHPELTGRPAAERPYDDTPRALARAADGSFRFFYGGELLAGSERRASLATGSAACFGHDDELLVADRSELRLVTLDEHGAPRRETRWPLAALHDNTTWNLVRFPELEAATTEGELMDRVGTIETLAGHRDAKTLQADLEAMFTHLDLPTARSLLARARRARLERVLGMPVNGR